jgi:hypothetical protein
MKIYVGGLWAQPKRRELNELIARQLRGPWYRLRMPRGRLASCQLLEMTDPVSDTSEFCAVIEVQPARLGWEVLQQLEGLRTHGTILRAHKWFPRKGVSDRRDHSGVLSPEVARERRTGTDRRRALQIEPVGAHRVQAMQGFERSYGA